MVVKKESDKDKKSVSIKATAGAWWKSTAAKETAADTSGGAAAKKTSEAQEAKPAKKVATKPVRATRATKPKTTAKKAPVPRKTKKEIETAAVTETAPVEEAVKAKTTRAKSTRSKTATTVKTASTPRKSRAKTPAKAAPKTTPKTAPRAAAKPKATVKSKTSPASQSAEAVDTKEAVVAEAQGVTPAKKPTRARRPRAAKPASTKKSSAVDAEVVAETVGSESSPGAELQVEPQAKESSAAKKPAAKRSGTRGRRGRPTKKAETTQETGLKAGEAEKNTDLNTYEEVEDVKDGVAIQAADIEASGETAEKDTAADSGTTRTRTSKTEKGSNAEPAEQKPEVKKVSKLLINAEEPEECRLALLEDGRLESIHVSTISRTQTKNNIYKARIVAIEPSLQAAFVDYGTEKNGFLPFSEIHPEYYKQDLSAEIRQQVENQQWKKIRITDVLERGQEILAQVVKEEVGKKGANMTTYLSIPGRCVVLMPGSDSSGISRKISGEQRRSQLRETMTSMDLPEGIGWIVRTASVDITPAALTRDVEYLLDLWSEIKGKGQKMDGVGLVYEDQKSVLRFLREHFDPSIQEILVDDRTALEEVKEFVKMLPAQQRTVNVRLHQGARPIFNQYSVEDQIESIYQPQVSLPSGGSIVIDPTEALVAIDVNSGSTSKGKNFEASIFQANIEAATELARQLRLRDLGGLVVVDFIDMRNKKHILAVEREVKVAMKKDKAKVDFSRISKFGLMQISRQKLGAPIEAGNYRRCEHCKGRGTVRSVETLSLYYLRRIQTGASRKPVEKIECHFPLDVASYLLNNKRSELFELEKRYQVEITITGEVDMKPADNEVIFHKIEKENNSQKQA